MEVVLRGVRGSIANPSSETLFYGGHTTCLEVRTNEGALILFDAGTGLFQMNNYLPVHNECHIFFTHAHADHIQGLCFFKPMHDPEWKVHLYSSKAVQETLFGYLAGQLFPVPFQSFRGNIHWHIVEAGTPVHVTNAHDLLHQGVQVEPLAACHPGGGLGYKVRGDGGVFFYSGDHEITPTPMGREYAQNLLRGVNLAVVDAMFSKEDYQPDWGHSMWEEWVGCAEAAGVGCLVLSHHEPTRSDRTLDEVQRVLQRMEKPGGPKLLVAKEGDRFFPPQVPTFVAQPSDWLSIFLDSLSRFREESTILDRILAKSREVTGADAGTVFVAEGNELVFAYTHNDSLFSVDTAYKHAYSTLRSPLSKESIAGYTAITGNVLNLPDVRHLPQDVPYSFNDTFDNSTGYRTESVLCVPFYHMGGEIAGVLQLINSHDSHTGKVCPFSPGSEQYVKLLAREARNILERGTLLRKHIYRMLHMAASHDPAETGPHAERVGAIAAEIFQVWGTRQGISLDKVRYEKSCIRLAAMLHDVGKVGVSDLILKKPAGLTDDEFTVMRRHTTMGAAILYPSGEDIADMAYEIALHHHQKWDGTGYAGAEGQGKLAGEAIPLAARITALADVFDALVSPRCYKKAWPFENAMKLIRDESGKHFDPSLVSCMEEVYALLPMIYTRFPDS